MIARSPFLLDTGHITQEVFHDLAMEKTQGAKARRNLRGGKGGGKTSGSRGIQPASPGGFLLRVSAALETYVRGSAFSLT